MLVPQSAIKLPKFVPQLDMKLPKLSPHDPMNFPKLWARDDDKPIRIMIIPIMNGAGFPPLLLLCVSVYRLLPQL